MSWHPFARRRAPSADPHPPENRQSGAARTKDRIFSLRLRLLCLVVLVIVPWLGLVLYTQADERTVAIANVNSDAMRLIRIATSNQAAQIEAARQLLRAFVRLPQVSTRNAAGCNAFFAEMLSAYPLYLNLARAELDGDVSCSALPMRSPINVADRPYFKRALETRGFAIGDYQVGRITKLPSVVYAYPVVDAKGQVEGIVIVVQSLSWLTAALSNLEFPPGSTLVVTDGNGTVLARVPGAEGSIGKTLPEQQVLAKLSSQKEGGVFEADDAQGIRRLWAHAPLIAGLDIHASVGVPRSVALADINRRLIRNLVGLGLVTVLALAAAWFGGKFFILRQVDALVVATRRLASGEPARGRVCSAVGASSSCLPAASTPWPRRWRRETVIFGSLKRGHGKRRSNWPSRVRTWRSPGTFSDRFCRKSRWPSPACGLQGVASPRSRSAVTISAISLEGAICRQFHRRCVRTRRRCRAPHGGGAHDIHGPTIGSLECSADPCQPERSSPRRSRSVLPLHERMLRDFRCDHPRTQLCKCRPSTSPTAAGTRDQLPIARRGRNAARVKKGVDFAEVKMRLQAGDIVVFYTDGITETLNEDGDLFGSTAWPRRWRLIAMKIPSC